LTTGFQFDLKLISSREKEELLKTLGVDKCYWEVSEYREEQLKLAAKLIYKSYDSLTASMEKAVKNSR
jgi:hypothetical protein